MPRCSVPHLFALGLSVLALMVAPSAAASLASGLPGHPSVADYARCTVRSFLVTPKPPVSLGSPRALPRGVEARNQAPRADARTVHAGPVAKARG